MGVAMPGRGGDPVAAHDASRAVEHSPLVGNQLQTQLRRSHPLAGGGWKRLLAPARSVWGKKLKGEEKTPKGRSLLKHFVTRTPTN